MSNQTPEAVCEAASIKAELDPGFEVLWPARQSCPFVFCSPHSGRIYTKAFVKAAKLNAHDLRASEDCYVDELFAGAIDLGAPMLTALFPRAYLDVNREAYELDPKLFREPLPDYANTQSVRVCGGLGTIARIVAEAQEIYATPLSLAAGLERIAQLYEPFHDALTELLTQTRNRFGMAFLIDCHSMPSANFSQHSRHRPDFVLGDRFGDACDGRLTSFISDALSDLGYRVKLNRPYAGGFITQHYGAPQQGIHALQIEINRALYMDEQTLLHKPVFAKVKSDLREVAAMMFTHVPQLLAPRAAAE